MKTKKFQVRDVFLQAEKWFNEERGHDRCYSIYYLNCDEETEYGLPIYGEVPQPLYLGEVTMIGRTNFEIRYPVTGESVWVSNKKSWNDALNAICDMFIADNLHKTMIEYNIYKSIKKDELYYVQDQGLWWLYYVNEGGEKTTDYLIGCVHNKPMLDYVLKVFELGPEFILKALDEIRRFTRER